MGMNTVYAIVTNLVYKSCDTTAIHMRYKLNNKKFPQPKA